MTEKYEHSIYKHCDIKEADGVAWAFVNKDKMVQFPFKFPPVGDDEIRVNVLYAGLCQSDVHTVRGIWGPCPYPIAPGHEIVGEVSLVGKNVKDFKKGDIVGYFAYYVMNSGMKKSIFMSKDEMERFARKYSKSYGNRTSTDCWTHMFDEMAKKTCLKRLIKKYGIINESKPIETAMKYDSGVVKENGEVEYIDNESNVETQEPLKLGAENE